MLADKGFASWTRAAHLDASRLDARFYGPAHVALLDRLDASGLPSAPLGRLLAHLAHVTGYESVKHMGWVSEGSGVRVVEAQNIGDGLLRDSKWKLIRPDGFANLTRHHLHTGDVVFSKDGTLGSAALVGSRFLPAVASRHVFRMQPKRGVDGGFLAAWLTSSAGTVQTQHRQAGAVQGTIITPEVAAFRVLTPSPGIQRAIGNNLRKAERLQELGNNALQSAESLLVASTAQFPRSAGRTSWLSGDSVRHGRLDAEFYQQHFLAADEWLGSHHTQTLASLMSSGSYGVLPKSEDYGSGDLRFLRATDIGHLYVEEENALRVPRSYADPKGIARAGDVLLEVKGRIAGGAVCPAEADGCLVNGSIFRIRPRPGIDPDYLAAVLVGAIGVAQKHRAASNSVISYVSLEFVRSLRIPRLGEDEEVAIGDGVRRFDASRREAMRLALAAKSAVEALIDGTLDEATLLDEGDTIERWLAENPSPSKGA